LVNVEKDLKEIKVKRWQQKAVDREELASVIQETKLSEGCTATEQVSNLGK
jgi:hypothetical protein